MKQIKRFLKDFALIRKFLQKRNNYLSQKIIQKNIKTLQENGSLLNTLSHEQKEHWKPRIKLLLESSDNEKILHTSKAGKFNKDYNLLMHNGLIIDPLSYYGLPMLEALFKNKGVHEPQEEYAFQEVLKEIPDSGVMIELGSYWSFYSMWFNLKIKNPTNYMIEPENVDSGIKNFTLNKMKGDFTKAYISDCSVKTKDEGETPTICIDDFIKEKNIEFVDILHSDIQGYEFLMLKGAEETLDKKNVGYIFVSTHSQDLHFKCMDYLKLKGYILVCSSDLDESYSWDGLLVFKNPDYNGLETINISKREVNKRTTT
jgi:FkbM family methyltransferase